MMSLHLADVRSNYAALLSHTSVSYDGSWNLLVASDGSFDNSVSSERIMALRQISALGNLELDWDGYGGLPISPEVRQNAAVAVGGFPRDLPMPEITPNPNGTISFDWDSAFGSACFEVGKSRFSFYIKWPSGEPLLMDGRADEAAGVGNAVLCCLYPSLPASSISIMVVALGRFRYSTYDRR